VLQSLDDDQAQEIISIPLEGKTSIADHMVIASGRSTRQVAAMAQKLAERIKQGGFGHVRIEGLPAADWVLIDAGDVVVHLFRPKCAASTILSACGPLAGLPPPPEGPGRAMLLHIWPGGGSPARPRASWWSVT
jgi:ribosome silencing factor RsfS/YbeB/iojap